MQKLIDALYRYTDKECDRQYDCDKYHPVQTTTYLILDIPYALRGDLEVTNDGAASRIAAFLCPETFWHTCTFCPVRPARLPPSVNCSDPVPTMVVAGAAAKETTTKREVTQACFLTGSYHPLPPLYSLSNSPVLHPFTFSPTSNHTYPPTT